MCLVWIPLWSDQLHFGLAVWLVWFLESWHSVRLVEPLFWECHFVWRNIKGPGTNPVPWSSFIRLFYEMPLVNEFCLGHFKLIILNGSRQGIKKWKRPVIGRFLAAGWPGKISRPIFSLVLDSHLAGCLWKESVNSKWLALVASSSESSIFHSSRVPVEVWPSSLGLANLLAWVKSKAIL